MSEGPFLIPQTVFVGDVGRLVVPFTDNLSGELSVPAATAIVITDRLPFNENITVKRIEVDIRAKQILIDFMAFKPGVLEIPGIPDLQLPPLTVNIASILEREGYSEGLSPPEKPLAAPGTFALIIGGTAALIALVAAVVFFALYGPKNFRIFFEKARVRFLIYKTKRAILKIQNALAAGRIGAKEGVTALGETFKAFLSALYRKNYVSYSAEDFLSDTAFSGSEDAVYRIFAACDRLRFSPALIEQDAANGIAEKTLSYIEGRVIEGRVA
jgi:hypothetical protein